MRLRVWLPLNGTLENKGLENKNITKEGTGITTVDGKIGKCFQFPNNCASFIHMEGFNLQTGSWAAWIKVLGEGSASRQCLISEGRDSYNDGVEFYTSQNGTTLSFKAHKIILSTSIELNKWYHVIGTFGDNLIKLYINGVLIKSGNYTEDMTYTYSNNRFVLGKMSYGYTNTGTYFPFNGCLNDVRIYDHALSPLEVKHIAQGLILHYPLNRGGLGQENLIAGTDFNGSPKKYTVTSNTEGGFIYTPTETILANTEYTVSCQLRGNANMNLYKLCTGGNEAINWINRSQLSTTEYRPFSITFTYPSNKTLNQIYICTRYGTSNTSTGDWFEIKPNSLKLEKGSIATPWCPNSSDALATTMGLNNNVEYDTSGYGNNGEYYAYDTNGSISYTSDTPKYNVSTHIASANPTQHAASGTRYLYGHCKLMNPTQMSVAFWLKPITGGYGGTTSNGQGYFCTTNYEYGNTSVGVDYQTSAMNHRDGTVNMNDSTSTTQCNVTFYPTIGEWHHYVYTYDGQVGRGYKDGVQTATAQFSAAKTLDSFIGVVIGFSKAGGVWRRNDACYSDFRVYATALSVDEVKSLYNNSAYIDNQGNIYGAVYEEV